MRRIVVPLAALALFAAGCNESKEAQAPAAQAPAAAPAQAVAPVKGKVLERVDAAPYSYLKLATAEGKETWAAVPQAEIAQGSDVTVGEPMKMVNFESKSLGRTFDEIWFGTLGAAPAAGSPHGAMGGMAGMGPHGAGEGNGEMAGSPHANVANTAVDMDVKVEKAAGEGAHTVAEVYAHKGHLADKPVLVRGKVVKFNAGIMGKNWIHLRDGSGTAEKGDHDLTVTTDATATVGDVVTVTGMVHTDKDFGAGYVYGVIVEDAKVTK